MIGKSSSRDILFVSKERSHIIHEQEIKGVPDLIVEILSPGTADSIQGYKRKLYARYGVMEYRIIDPDKQIIQLFRLKNRAINW